MSRFCSLTCFPVVVKSTWLAAATDEICASHDLRASRFASAGESAEYRTPVCALRIFKDICALHLLASRRLLSLRWPIRGCLLLYYNLTHFAESHVKDGDFETPESRVKAAALRTYAKRGTTKLEFC